MPKEKKNKALGKGLKALIRDGSEKARHSQKDSEIEKHARNMEFYGSMMKKYVKSQAEDELIDQMLNDVRIHLGISKKDHVNLLQTLRRRELQKPVAESEQKIAQTEIKEELSRIYKRLNTNKKKQMRTNRFRRLEESMGVPSRGDTISLSDGTDMKKKMVRKVIKRRLVARDLDERAGIIEGPNGATKGKIEWSNEDDKPIMVPGPKEGLEDNVETIISSPPKKELEDSARPIKAGPHDEGGVDAHEDKMSRPRHGREDQERSNRDRHRKLDERSGPAIEAPPSYVPTGPGFGFMMSNERKENNSKEIVGEESVDHLYNERTEYAPEESKSGIGSGGEMQDNKDGVRGMEDETGTDEDVSEDLLDDSLISMKLLVEEDRIDEAYEMGERMLEEDQDNIAILNEMGVILFHKGMIQEAIALYKGMLDQTPDSIETLINYATLLSITGELDESLDCLDRAVKKDPYSEDAWNNKAVVLASAGRLREALECLDEALRINEDSISTWTNVGVVLEKMGEIGPAMECYENLLKLDPGNKVAIDGIESCRSTMG